MATTINTIKCPNCNSGSLALIDRMVRCICGWWTFLEEEESVTHTNVDYATAVVQ